MKPSKLHNALLQDIRDILQKTVIVYHPGRIKLNHLGRSKVNHCSRMKMSH